MRHQITSDDIRAPEMAEAVEKCVHCGFCLAACPTYALLGEEMDSPRGRIYLMKTVLEQQLPAEEAQPYIDRCLGCMACVPACPSGVAYGDLLLGYRALHERERRRPALDALTRQLIRETLPYPGRFRMAARAGKLGRALLPALPEAFAAMLSLLPERLPKEVPMPAVLPAIGERRGKVALLLGCVQRALAPEISYAAANVLASQGVEVHIPPGQGCCGSILLHIGEEAQAQAIARRNFETIPPDVDAIITTAAGCGSGMKEYPLLFKDQPDAEAASDFSHKVMDFSAYMAGLGLRDQPGFAKPQRVVYQDACHLLHAQGHQSEPRSLLKAVPNLELVGMADAGMCCGSAGTYNIDQPDIAAELGRRKAERILETEADLVASGNIGCIMQIRGALAGLGSDLPVMHIAQILHQTAG